MVFCTDLIQICEVHTHSQLPIFLLHHYSIGQPLRVKHFFNSPSLLKFYHLVFDASEWSLDEHRDGCFLGGNRWNDIQMMTDEVRIHPRSFISNLCEHVNIPSEKLYQLFLLLKRQLSSDLKKVFRIIIYNKLL